MDLDGNGEISEEEFIKRCMEDEYLVGLSISVSILKAGPGTFGGSNKTKNVKS